MVFDSAVDPSLTAGLEKLPLMAVSVLAGSTGPCSEAEMTWKSTRAVDWVTESPGKTKKVL